MSAINQQIQIKFVLPQLPNPSALDPYFDLVAYNFNSDFFLITDAFNLELAVNNSNYIQALPFIRQQLQMGTEIQLVINNAVQMAGIIDEVEYKSSRNGTTINIKGRDKLGMICDDKVVANLIFKPNTPLITIIETILAPYGFTKNNLVIDDNVNLNKATLSKQKIGLSIKGKTSKGRAHNYAHKIAKQCKPNRDEGRLEYLMRILHRNGLFLKLLPDGKNIYVGGPIYDRETGPIYQLSNVNEHPDGNNPGLSQSTIQNNIDSINLNLDFKKQISYMIAEGSTGGGQFRRDIPKVILGNEIVLCHFKDNIPSIIPNEVKQYLTKYPQKILNEKLLGLIKLPTLHLDDERPDPETDTLPLGVLNPRIDQFYDDQAHTPEQLEFSSRKRLYEIQNSYFELEVEVAGHFNYDAIWQINSMVNVKDYITGLNGTYWIQSRSFTKTRGNGAKTKLKIKLPYIYEFGVQEDQDTVEPPRPQKTESSSSSFVDALKPGP